MWSGLSEPRTLLADGAGAGLVVRERSPDREAAGVAWYDTRGLSGERPGWNYRFRTSLDGGDTWQPSVRVSEQKTTLANRGPGHTGGLAAAADGTFHLLWIDGRTGQQQVWTARVTVSPR
jgi:hypothetical protein